MPKTRREREKGKRNGGLGRAFHTQIHINGEREEEKEFDGSELLMRVEGEFRG